MKIRTLVFDTNDGDRSADRFRWVYPTYNQGQEGASKPDEIKRTIAILKKLDAVSDVDDEVRFPGMDEGRKLKPGRHEIELTIPEWEQLKRFLDTGFGRWTPVIQKRWMEDVTGFVADATEIDKDAKPGPVAVDSATVQE